MNQRIFSLNLPVETTSVYLACCGLTDENQTLTKEKLLSVWNLTEEILEKSLAELMERQIIIETIKDNERILKITEENHWK